MNLIPHAARLFPLACQNFKSPSENGSAGDLQRELIDLYVSSWPFEEAFYLEHYSDVKAAIKDGHWPSAWHHFRAVGFFEGRFPIRVQVDPDWYLAQYADVAGVVKSGKIPSAEQHFFQFGYKEGRLPQRPSLQHRWYASRYLPGASIEECERHYVTSGYLKGAIPARPTG